MLKTFYKGFFNKRQLRNLAICLAGGAVALLWSVSAFAGSAVRLYVELSSDTAVVWPTEHIPQKDYLRARVLCLDSNNELATEFNGAALSSADIIIASEEYSSDIQLALKPATALDLTSGDWEPAGTVTTALDNAWLQFAVSYDAIDTPGTDRLIITLQQGTATIVAYSPYITVDPPLANMYVVRSGGISDLPNVLEEIQPPKENDNRVLRAGDALILDVFAAFYRASDGKYYFTDKVPSEALNVIVDDEVAGTLQDGYVRLDHSKGFTPDEEDLSQADDDYRNGKTPSHSAFTAEGGHSRQVGNYYGDVSDDEYLRVTPDAYIFSEVDLGDNPTNTDSSTWKAKPLDKITIVGLPLNEITADGAHRESGYLDGQQHKSPGTVLPGVEDWQDSLLDDEVAEKPWPAFRVPGSPHTTTYIYGAIVGVNDKGNPVPFYEPAADGSTTDDLVVFYLRRTSDDGSGTVAVNNAGSMELQGFAQYSRGKLNDTKITATYENQAFIPFKITATAVTADGSFASITNLYIADIKFWNGSSYEDYPYAPLYEDIDEEDEGIDFIAQDTIASVTMTELEKLDGQSGGSKEAEIEIQSKGGEWDFDLKMIVADDGTNLDKGTVDEGALGTIIVPNDEDHIARVFDLWPR